MTDPTQTFISDIEASAQARKDAINSLTLAEKADRIIEIASNAAKKDDIRDAVIELARSISEGFSE